MENALTVFLNMWTFIGIIGGIAFLADRVCLMFEGFKDEKKPLAPKWIGPEPVDYSAEDIKKIQHNIVKPVFVGKTKEYIKRGDPVVIVQPKKRGRKPGFSQKKKPEGQPKETREKYARRPFVIPTVDEVMTYCKERENSVDPQKFVDFYTAKGWMIGKNLMKDWEAAFNDVRKKRGLIK